MRKGMDQRRATITGRAAQAESLPEEGAIIPAVSQGIGRGSPRQGGLRDGRRGQHSGGSASDWPCSSTPARAPSDRAAISGLRRGRNSNNSSTRGSRFVSLTTSEELLQVGKETSFRSLTTGCVRAASTAVGLARSPLGPATPKVSPGALSPTGVP